MRELKLISMKQNSLDGGVAVDPTPITAKDEITILYNGLLANSGANEVYLHVGYGSNDQWQNVQDYRMYFTNNGWEKSFTVNDTSRLNFCFKDPANNWDNNNGVNWSLEIHNGEQ